MHTCSLFGFCLPHLFVVLNEDGNNNKSHLSHRYNMYGWAGFESWLLSLWLTSVILYWHDSLAHNGGFTATGPWPAWHRPYTLSHAHTWTHTHRHTLSQDPLCQLSVSCASQSLGLFLSEESHLHLEPDPSHTLSHTLSLTHSSPSPGNSREGRGREMVLLLSSNEV